MQFNRKNFSRKRGINNESALNSPKRHTKLTGRLKKTKGQTGLESEKVYTTGSSLINYSFCVDLPPRANVNKCLQ